jgi:hypothetical protein
MNEVQFAYKVRQHLNRGLHELRPETIARLAVARERALERQKIRVSQSVLASAGGYFQYHFDNYRLKQIVASIALLVAVVSSTLWLADQRVKELGAIDSALLANDLPLAAFTDKGFDTWLKRGSSE